MAYSPKSLPVLGIFGLQVCRKDARLGIETWIVWHVMGFWPLDMLKTCGLLPEFLNQTLDFLGKVLWEWCGLLG